MVPKKRKRRLLLKALRLLGVMIMMTVNNQQQFIMKPRTLTIITTLITFLLKSLKSYMDTGSHRKPRNASRDFFLNFWDPKSITTTLKKLSLIKWQQFVS